ncbi:Putative bifunctional phosphatase/peptidyl-prolyl cis-trans isomerase [Corynebacterium capitovis DSM 44611]|uniref:peptidylprolyl isomerase n=1 Tax=Corynebacterium capitovis TaxID=131081 RepID=UPI00035CB36D|nr:peptidylprolyl isomerase [Corynebacterium capitovis]WKD57566.1 Putative bifunctional phosphatase/peptidyl-prolyl cis-trans isomerase [Corynebacterium capitovis DSM 44611]
MVDNKQRGEQALDSLKKELAARDRKESSTPWKIAALSAAVLIAAGGGIYYLARQGDEGSVSATGESSASSTAEATTSEAAPAEPLALARATALPATVTCSYPASTSAASKDAGTPPTENIAATGTATVKLDTSAGAIGMELDRSVSPCTVNAIEYLAGKGYFDDSVCHRLTTSEGLKVLQCGDPSGTGSGGPGFQFANEYPTDEALDKIDTSTLPEGISEKEANSYTSQLLQYSGSVTYPRGTIAMANAGLGTNGSQFFLNYGDSTLPPLYTYFGKINDEGLATLDAIAQKGAEGGTADGAPAEEVRIRTATVSG